MTTELATIDHDAVLRYLNLNPTQPATQALLLICDRYNLDPVMKHLVLIDGKPYVTRDGYLHVAHLSGQFDGMEVVDMGDNGADWWAKVAVYRRDMSHPFTYIGRYPKAGQNKRYGPEVAIKTAEVMALRRAFDVAGVAAADEQWDAVEQVPAVPATEDTIGDLMQRIADLDDAQVEVLRARWKANYLPRVDSGELTVDQASLVFAWLDELATVDLSIVPPTDSAVGQHTAVPCPACGLPVDVGADGWQEGDVCPHCGTPWVVAGEDTPEDDPATSTKPTDAAREALERHRPQGGEG